MRDTGSSIVSGPVTMTPEEERWAEALAIERIHGVAGPAWIATRAGELAMAGDAAGVRRFRQIAERYELLIAKRTTQ